MSTKHGKEEKRRPIVAALATIGLTAATIAVTAVPSSAANEGGTGVTFEILAPGDKALSISVPDGSNTRVDLGSASAGTSSTGTALGAVTVSDNRGVLALETWNISVRATDFQHATVTGVKIEPSDIEYAVPSESALQGLVTGGVVAVPHTSLGSSLNPRLTSTYTPVITGTTTVGSGTLTWSPQISIHTELTDGAGVYNGTIFHQVL